MAKTIIITWTAKGWLANFVGDPEMKAMFGTTQILTAFTAQASRATVIINLEKLNPGYKIY